MAWTYTFRRRIAVTGLRHAGKSVFITSLINHLQYHDEERFDLGGYGSISGFTEIDGAAASAFPYEHYRRRMARDAKWPEKTSDRSRYACYVEFSRARFGNINLEFRDFPGERFADVWMEGASYEQWSDRLLCWWQDDDEYTSHVQRYIDLLSTGALDEDELIAEYKHALYGLAADYKPLISPSTFLIRPDGKQAPEAPEHKDEVVRDWHVGVDAESQFVPLSREAIRGCPELAKEFKTRYKIYQKHIVRPLMKSLRECDRMIVLVDIPTILQAGPGMLDDSVKILEYMLAGLQPSGFSKFKKWSYDWWSKYMLYHKWRPGEITRLYFVAAQSDKVPPSEHDNLVSLLRDMTGGIASRCRGVRPMYDHASAVVSTSRPLNKSSFRGLSGRECERLSSQHRSSNCPKLTPRGS